MKRWICLLLAALLLLVPAARLGHHAKAKKCGYLAVCLLLALVLKADYWWIAAAIQSESLLKVPLCALRIRTGQWIHDVTVRKERGQ